MKTVCIYHGNCADGFGAAWAVRKALGEIEFHAGVYQNPPPNVTNCYVVVVDFSYKREVMLSMAQKARGVLVLDHHKSAIEDLAADKNYIVDFGAYAGRVDWNRFVENADQDIMEGAPYGRIYTVFDNDRSGAGLTWDFFHPGEPRPPLIDHIEDRDLWRFKLPGTRAIQAALFSFPYDFDTWGGLIEDSVMPDELDKLRIEGEAIERKHHKDVAELIGVCKRRLTIGGHSVWAASLPYTLTSDAGHMMADPGEPFAACYWDTQDGRVFSLRSRDDGMDVAEIAKLYGGGGHKHASGFRVPFNKLTVEGAPASVERA